MANEVIASESKKKKPDEAYLDYQHLFLAMVAMAQRQSHTVVLAQLDLVLAKRLQSLTEDRALWYIAQNGLLARDAERNIRAFNALRELAYSGHTTMPALKARLEFGWRLLATDEKEEGKKLLKTLPKEDPWKSLVEWSLENPPQSQPQPEQQPPKP